MHQGFVIFVRFNQFILRRVKYGKQLWSGWSTVWVPTVESLIGKVRSSWYKRSACTVVFEISWEPCKTSCILLLDLHLFLSLIARNQPEKSSEVVVAADNSVTWVKDFQICDLIPKFKLLIFPMKLFLKFLKQTNFFYKKTSPASSNWTLKNFTRFSHEKTLDLRVWTSVRSDAICSSISLSWFCVTGPSIFECRPCPIMSRVWVFFRQGSLLKSKTNKNDFDFQVCPCRISTVYRIR